MNQETDIVKVPEASNQQESGGMRLYDFLIVAVICFSILTVERLIERQFWPQFEFQSVDVQKIIQQEIELTSRIQMTPEERMKRGLHFSRALESEVAALSKNGRLVLVAPAVVSGAVDRTEDVQAAILRNLK